MKVEFKEFSVGDVIKFKKEFGLEDFNNFSKLSGDFNPLHHDPEYAATSGHSYNIVPLHLIIAPLSP